MIARLLPAWLMRRRRASPSPLSPSGGGNVVRRLMGALSTRTYLAIGLSSLTVTLLMLAGLAGVLPDTEAAERRHRADLAETVALAASLALDEQQPALLQGTLDFVRQRHTVVESIGMRRSDGSLLAATTGHDEAWQAGAGAAAGTATSTETRVQVPVLRGDQRWGTVELGLKPLKPPGWRGWLANTELRLGVFMGLGSLLGFSLYLRRMLRHLDPSRAVPQRVRHALDTLTEGLLVLDNRGRIVLANQSLAQLLGMPAEALLGQAAQQFGWTDAHGRPVAADDLPWSQALAAREVQRNGVLYLTSPDGRRTTFRTNASPIVGPDGRGQGVLASLQDVTELEQKEAALRIAKDEADQANQSKSQFLANMSHEIRTPMNAILGFTDVLRRGALKRPDEAARHLDIIHSSGRHLLNLINDILDLSKVEAGRMEVERIAFAPHQVAHEVVQTLAVRAQEKGLTLDLLLPQAMPATLQGDPARLRQILTNLLGNALKFTERGRVSLALRTEGPDYVFDVTDTGIGIAADKLESVFEPFTQAEASTTRRFGGTGLGLTISRGFARAMGGDITARSTLGRGTTFSCRIPLGVAGEAGAAWLPPEALRQQATAPAPVHAERWRFPTAKRILVVDDGAENRQLVRIVLEEVGLEIEEAENGQIAVQRAAREAFDLVLMDMQMPVMDGLTATRTMREIGLELPILALTANAMKGFEKEIEGSGFDGFLVKPVDIDALLAELARRLGGVRDTTRRAAEPAATAAQVPSAPPATAEITEDMRFVPLPSRLAAHPKLGPLAERFARQLPERLAAMAAANDTGDHAQLAALAHSLKGAGGSMGYDDLFEPARDLESAAKAGDPGAARAALARLGSLADRIALATESADEVGA